MCCRYKKPCAACTIFIFFRLPRFWRLFEGSLYRPAGISHLPRSFKYIYLYIIYGSLLVTTILTRSIFFIECSIRVIRPFVIITNGQKYNHVTPYVYVPIANADRILFFVYVSFPFSLPRREVEIVSQKRGI